MNNRKQKILPPEEFMDKYYSQIIKEALRHKDKTGYIEACIDTEGEIIENSFVFIEGEFNRDEFTYIPFPPKNPEHASDICNIFYSIRFKDKALPPLMRVKEVLFFCEHNNLLI